METPYQPCVAHEPPDVQALREGNERAFRCLVEQERERLYRFVLKILNDKDEAENVVQETFAEAYRQIDRFRGESKVSTWLFSIARHLAYGVLRKAKRHNYLEHDTIEHIHAHADEGHTSASMETVEQEERKRLVHAALQELPDHYRRIIELRDLEERSTAETAEALGLTSVNVRVRLHRARKELGTYLNQYLEPGEA
ncbi:MAG: sigma-70 family RNA polymerase sigma factor [Bacteroidetes bacterium]|jgi:RNA polymerase sigma-70 factor (ECF subfamily)|nr:sigma-70 family RNA polymerase sigma factor [Bacteroidota bacterium]